MSLREMINFTSTIWIDRTSDIHTMALIAAITLYASSRLASCAASSSHRLPVALPPSAFPTRFHPYGPRSGRLPTRMQFFWTGRLSTHKALLEALQQEKVIKSERVAEAMEHIDRKLFVPESGVPYVDSPMPIGYNATISAPHMHAHCLELLQNHLQPGMRALDVGSGTGYLTACFALMVGEQGRAVGVEHIPQLVEGAIENVKASKAAPLLQSGRLTFHIGDGRDGWPEESPYDAIHVGAAASKVPDALLQQLKLGGRMVIPVGDFFQDLYVIEKQADGSLKQWSEASVRYVPLTSKTEQLGF